MASESRLSGTDLLRRPPFRQRMRSADHSATSFEQFQASERFPELDGLRAISVLMVLALHTGDAYWRGVHGYLGVTTFFVISGFLITTLLLREQRHRGRVSLGAFYVRRAFRILPLYYLALAAFSALVLAGFGGVGGSRSAFGHRLPYFLTFLNEFAGLGTFVHSWSLGIEEKFYLLWPLLAFVVPLTMRRRPWLAGGLFIASVIVGMFDPSGYVGIYVPIVAGCCLALIMDSRRGFRLVSWLAHPAVSILAVAAVILSLVMYNDGGNVHVGFALAVALTFPTLLIGRPGARKWLTIRPMTFVGQRSYGIYLFHPIVLSAVELVVPSQAAWWAQITRLLLGTAGSVIVADVLYRTYERPLIRIGRRISNRRVRLEDTPAAAGTAEVPLPRSDRPGALSQMPEG